MSDESEEWLEGLADPVEVGRGGFGVVYRARELEFDRPVAVKIMLGSIDERTRQRFRGERRAMGTLSAHPHIVTVYRQGLTTDNRPYLVMEFLAGGSLSDQIEREGPLPWSEALSAGIQISSAIETAHRTGVLHRDLKPENVLVTDFGQPKVGDFGIARLEGEYVSSSGEILGSIPHSPPELFAGIPHTVAADVYSLGSTIVTLLLGRPPFSSPTDESLHPVIARITTAPLPDLTAEGVPTELYDVLVQAMAKEPAGRFQSALALARALQSVQARRGIAITPVMVPGVEPLPPSVPVVPQPSALDKPGSATIRLTTAEVRQARADVERLRAEEGDTSGVLAEEGLPPVSGRLSERIAVASTPEAATPAEPPVRVELQPGEVLFEQGTRGDRIYVVDEGEIDIVRVMPDGVEEHRVTLEAGDYFGEMGPLFGLPRSATARARTSAVVTGYTAVDFRSLVGEDGLGAAPERTRSRRRDGAEPSAPSEVPTPDSGEVPSNPLVPAVLKNANAVHKLASSLGRGELADRLASEAERWKESRTSVVVAGEIKRGKSSFINALLGRPGLLPVDADVATSVHLVIQYADELEVHVTRLVGDDYQTFPIDPGQLVSYASMMGDPAAREGVTSVRVGVPHPLLRRGLTVIDTPGVGGMTRGHRDIALASLELADALIFTVSSQEPILRSEVDFLAEASERIDTVLMVLTKVDVNREWTELLEEDREKLADYGRQLEVAARRPDAGESVQALSERFGRLLNAPFVPVSSRLKEKAIARVEAGREERAAELFERSGFEPIEQFLDSTISSRENVRLANICQLCASITARIETEEHERVRSADQDHGLQEELEGQREMLDRFVSRQARWRQRFAAAVQRIQAEVNREVARVLSRLEEQYRTHISNEEADVGWLLETLPADLERSVTAAWYTLGNVVNEQVQRAVVELVEEFDVPELEVEFSDLEVPDRIRTLARQADDALVDGGFNAVEDGLPFVTSAWIFSGMTTGLASAVGIGALSALGPAAIVGVPVALLITRARRNKRIEVKTRQELQRSVREALAAVRQEFAGDVSVRLIEIRTGVEELIDDRLLARRRELEAKQRDLARLVKEEVAERQKARASAQQAVDQAIALRQATEKLREQVYGALGV